MRHLKSGRKLNRTSSHKKALLRNLATSLFEHKRIHTTLAKAKELRPYAEQLITKAKDALNNEKAGALPQGHTIDIHTRRIVARAVQTKAVLQELFDSIAPVVAERNGGYTRIVKLGARRGDAGQMAIIELVDWNTEVVGQPKPKKAKKVAPVADAVVETVTPVEEKVAEVADVAEVVADSADEVVETVNEVTEETVEAVSNQDTEDVSDSNESSDEKSEDDNKSVNS